MTTAQVTAPSVVARRRVPATIRAGQALMAVPLGAFQFVAAVAFTITLGIDTWYDGVVAAWVIVMSPACAVTALRLGRGRERTQRTAFGLLAAQVGFGLVKLFVYHESASFVFFAFTAASLALLSLPASRRHFQGQD